MLRAFGLGTGTAVEFPVASGGRLRRPDEWSGTSAQSLAIGYEVSVTPLQLAVAYAAIANDGVLLRPTLVKQIRDPRGRVVYEHQPEPVRRAVRPEVAHALREMLRGVVSEGGTGQSAALRTYELAGKTGTAQRPGPRGYSHTEHTAVFAALFPADEPQLAMVVKLDAPKGGYAAQTTAPLTRRMLEQALAARTTGIDRNPLARDAMQPATARPAPARAREARAVVAWPVVPAADSAPPHRVPDVRGLSPREAVGQLHRAGFEVRLLGLGDVRSTDPSAGSMARPGTLIVVRTNEQGP